MGAYAPDAGQLRVNGQEVVFRSPRDSLRAGISCIFQELDLVPGMTVAENLLLADLPGRYGLIDPAARNRKAEALLARVGADFGPATIVEQLAVADRQLVAIAKALAVDVKVVLMDEPSAPLTAKELDRLFAVIGELKRAAAACSTSATGSRSSTASGRSPRCSATAGSWAHTRCPRLPCARSSRR